MVQDSLGTHTGDFLWLSLSLPTCFHLPALHPALCLHLSIWMFFELLVYTCFLCLRILLHFSACPWEAGSNFAHPEYQTPIPSQALGSDQCGTSLPTTLPQFNTWAVTSIQYSTLWIQLLSQLQIHKTPALIQPTFHHLSHKETMKATVSPRLKSRPAMFMAFT